MADILHGSARTTPRVRSELQASKETTGSLARRYENAGKMNGADFLRNVVKAFPHKIHTILTDNGMAFADLPKNRNGASRRYLGAHIFDRVCTENGIEHKLTKPYHPWTNGQAERMNRTIKDGDHPGLPLSKPRKSEGSRPGLRDCLQLCKAPQGSTMENALRDYLCCLDQRP
jgi:transposase InsO family protein